MLSQQDNVPWAQGGAAPFEWQQIFFTLQDLELSCTADWILEVFILAFGCDCSSSPF